MPTRPAVSEYTIPKSLKPRLADVAAKHAFASADALADHLIVSGLSAGGIREGSVRQRLERLVDEYGYSSFEEAVEHLLVRGLRAYEDPTATPEELEARLRGLGYIR
jgi:hypothetical protein